MSYKIVKYTSVFVVTDEVAVRRLAHEIGDADWLRESGAEDEAAGRDPLVTHMMEIIDQDPHRHLDSDNDQDGYSQLWSSVVECTNPNDVPLTIYICTLGIKPGDIGPEPDSNVVALKRRNS
jgi:hypothetical protein